jgi:type IV pilus assembly protein PilE
MNIQKAIAARRTHSAGFTLVELMVVVVIVSVLVGIAVPSYINSARKSRRTEAKTALVDLAGREERYFDTSSPPAYTATASNLGYGAGAFPMKVGSGYYNVNVVVTPPAGINSWAYTITATPVVGNDQAKDSHCQTFTLTNTGVQTSAPDTTTCWQ